MLTLYEFLLEIPRTRNETTLFSITLPEALHTNMFIQQISHYNVTHCQCLQNTSGDFEDLKLYQEKKNHKSGKSNQIF